MANLSGTKDNEQEPRQSNFACGDSATPSSGLGLAENRTGDNGHDSECLEKASIEREELSEPAKLRDMVERLVSEVGELRTAQNSAQTAERFQLVYGNIYGYTERGNVANNVDGSGEDSATWMFRDYNLDPNNLADFAYVVTLAVMADAPSLLVDQAADDLTAFFEKHIRTYDDTAPPITVGKSRDVLLQQIGAISKRSEGDGGASAEVISFKEQGSNIQLLFELIENVRLSQPWKPAFWSWLEELGLHRRDTFSTNAAQAAGVIAVLDFGTIQEFLLNQWMEKGAWNTVDDAVATFVSAGKKAARGVVDSLLQEWSLPNAPNKQMLAAGILASGATGFSMQDEALKTLSRMCRSRRRRAIALAHRGYLEWFELASHQSNLVSKVLESIEGIGEDFCDDDGLASIIGTQLFLAITSIGKSDDGKRSGNFFLQTIAPEHRAVASAARQMNKAILPNPQVRWAIDRFRAICIAGASRSTDCQGVLTMFCKKMSDLGDDEVKETLAFWLGEFADEIEDDPFTVEFLNIAKQNCLEV